MKTEKASKKPGKNRYEDRRGESIQWQRFRISLAFEDSLVIKTSSSIIHYKYKNNEVWTENTQKNEEEKMKQYLGKQVSINIIKYISH